MRMRRLEKWRRGESEFYGSLKTRKLLKNRKPETLKPPNWAKLCTRRVHGDAQIPGTPVVFQDLSYQALVFGELSPTFSGLFTHPPRLRWNGPPGEPESSVRWNAEYDFSKGVRGKYCGAVCIGNQRQRSRVPSSPPFFLSGAVRGEHLRNACFPTPQVPQVRAL